MGKSKSATVLDIGSVVLLRMSEEHFALSRIIGRGEANAYYRDGAQLKYGGRPAYLVATSKWIGRREELDLSSHLVRENLRDGKGDDADPYLVWVTAESPLSQDECEILSDRLLPNKAERVLSGTEVETAFADLGISWDLHLQKVSRELYTKYLDEQRKLEEKNQRAADRLARKQTAKTPLGSSRLGPPSGRYLVEETRTLFKKVVIQDADPKTFRELTPFWAVDKNHVFVNGKASARLDLKQLRVLNAVFISDGTTVYVSSNPIKNADGETFQVLDPGVNYDESVIPRPRFEGYARDKQALFFCENETGDVSKVENADLKSFVSLNNGYALDASHVYLNGKRLKNADPKSWRYLGHDYSSDAQTLYWQTQPMSGTDIREFAVINCSIADLATDGERFYHEEKALPRERWTELLKADHLEAVATLKSEFGINKNRKSPPSKKTSKSRR